MTDYDDNDDINYYDDDDDIYDDTDYCMTVMNIIQLTIMMMVNR